MRVTLAAFGDDHLMHRPIGLSNGNIAHALVRHCCGIMGFWGDQVC